MNKAVLMGRLTRDPDVRATGGETTTTMARFTLAVDRRYKKDGGQNADFVSCVAFGKAAEFAEKWLRKGIKIALIGRIQTGSYTNRDGVKVYTTDVVAEEYYFVESKNSGQGSDLETGRETQKRNDKDGFRAVPDDVNDEILPW